MWSSVEQYGKWWSSSRPFVCRYSYDQRFFSCPAQFYLGRLWTTVNGKVRVTRRTSSGPIGENSPSSNPEKLCGIQKLCGICCMVHRASEIG